MGQSSSSACSLSSSNSSSGKPGVPLKMSLIMCGVKERVRGEREGGLELVMLEYGLSGSKGLEWLVYRAVVRPLWEL